MQDENLNTMEEKKIRYLEECIAFISTFNIEATYNGVGMKTTTDKLYPAFLDGARINKLVLTFENSQSLKNFISDIDALKEFVAMAKKAFDTDPNPLPHFEEIKPQE